MSADADSTINEDALGFLTRRILTESDWYIRFNFTEK